MRTVCLTALIVCFCTATVAADEPFFSGPQVGEKLAGFKMKVVLGGKEGKELDPVTTAGDKPVAVVFVHQVTRPSIGLMRLVMNYASKRSKDGMQAAVVMLTSDVTESTNFIKRAKHAMPAGVVVGISPDGLEGPGAYGLNRKATVTALVSKGGKVTANFALIDPSIQSDGPKIATAIAAALGDEKPVTLAAIGGRKPAMRKPGARMQDPVLETKLRAVIQKTATAKQVETAATALEAYCDKTPAAAQRVGQITRRIIAAGKLENYGTPAAQTYLKKWSEKYEEPKSAAPRK